MFVAKLRVAPLLQFVKNYIKVGGEKMGFPENLARLQDERGETNYRLAKEIDVSQTSIKSWKDGACYPHPRHIKRLAKHFKVKEEVLTGKEEA